MTVKQKLFLNLKLTRQDKDLGRTESEALGVLINSALERISRKLYGKISVTHFCRSAIRIVCQEIIHTREVPYSLSVELVRPKFYRVLNHEELRVLKEIVTKDAASRKVPVHELFDQFLQTAVHSSERAKLRVIRKPARTRSP